MDGFFIETERVSLKTLGSEKDLETFVTDNADAVFADCGFGPLTLVRAQQRCGDGWLDALFLDSEERHIAVEFQLGRADLDHISRLTYQYMPAVNAVYGVLMAESFPPNFLDHLRRYSIPVVLVQVVAHRSGRLEVTVLNPVILEETVTDTRVGGGAPHRPGLSKGQWLQLALNHPELDGKRGDCKFLEKEAGAHGYGGAWMNASVAIGQAAHQEGRKIDAESEALMDEARTLGPQANWVIGQYRKLVSYQSTWTFTALGYVMSELGIAPNPEALPWEVE